MRRLLLLGSTGFIGGRLKRDLRARWDILDERVELRDAEAITNAVSRLRPDAVVNAAAWAGPDACEKDPQTARQINALGPAVLADACAKAHIPLFHFSTDLVFDGARAPYREEDDARPINIYGQVKREAEQRILAAHPGACVLRVSLVYGRGETGRQNFLDFILKELSAGRRAKVFVDQWRTPTPVASLPAVVEACLSKSLSGIFHWAGAERVNRLEFGRRVCAAFGLDESLLEPVRMADFPSAAVRPADCSLDCAKISAMLDLKPWTIARGLAA